MNSRTLLLINDFLHQYIEPFTVQDLQDYSVKKNSKKKSPKKAHCRFYMNLLWFFHCWMMSSLLELECLLANGSVLNHQERKFKKDTL